MRHSSPSTHLHTRTTNERRQAGKTHHPLSPGASLSREGRTEPVLSKRSRARVSTAADGGKTQPQASAPSRASASADETSITLLSLYFRDVAKMPPFSPEQEQQVAMHIRHKEQESWAALLELAELHVPLQQWFLEQADTRRLSFPLSTARRETWAQRLQQRDEDRKRILEAMAATRTHLKTLSTFARAAWARAQNALREAQAAKHVFAQANLRLVVTLARRFAQTTLSLSDLIQEGNLGLLKAIDRFDPDRGYRFSTYAAWWIRHAIARALADKGRSVRVPVHMLDASQRIARSRRTLTQELGRTPTVQEVSTDTQISLDKIQKMNSYLLDAAVSLDQSISAEDSRSLVDLLEDEALLAKPMDQLLEKDLLHETKTLMNTLSPMEMTVLQERFGLTNRTEEEKTLKEIGKQYRLSRERIRQIQEQALLKIRKGLQNKGLLEA